KGSWGQRSPCVLVDQLDPSDPWLPVTKQTCYPSRPRPLHWRCGDGLGDVLTGGPARPISPGSPSVPGMPWRQETR
uniref:Uncharacterized protein n=1 Tax=Oryzias melastigma TaxID=30732 RepID=A0A3B3DEY3_ORYME